MGVLAFLVTGPGQGRCYRAMAADAAPSEAAPVAGLKFTIG